MAFSIPQWLVWVLPPLLGAIIGYVTNALAIKMLFRPLTKKYFLGIPLPLTPGIIPRQRESLAHSIARMVSRSLFNAQVIVGHIRAEKFQTALKLQLGELIAPGAVEVVPGELELEDPDDPVVHIRRRIARFEELLLPLLQSPGIRRLLRNLLHRAAGDIGARKLGEFLPAKARNREELEDFLKAQIHGEAFRRLKWGTVLWVKRQTRENTPLNTFFSAAGLRRGVHMLDRLYVPGVNFLLDFLRRPEIRKELVKRGKGILSDILLRLSPVQRIVISAGQYDKTLEENMPGIIRDLLRTLETTLRAPENREKIMGALHELLRSIQQQGLADLQESYDIDLARSLHRLFGSLQALAIREDLAGKLAEAVVQRSASPQSPSIDELLESYAGLSLGELIDRLLDLLLKWVDDDERRDKVLSELAGIIDAGRRRKSADSSEEGETGVSLRPVTAVEADRRMLDALSSGVTMLIEGAVPALVERFDIYQMVVDRINALAVEDVEQLLLGIIARHLKYINIFGAILGALIGAAQLLLRLVG
jgi:uncharacterized membrane-anchored protein YjiN (DUF445 family)